MKFVLFFLLIGSYASTGLTNCEYCAPKTFPPIYKDKKESIEYRVASAQASISMIKHYLQQIDTHCTDYQIVQDSACKMMKYVLNVERCISGENSTKCIP